MKKKRKESEHDQEKTEGDGDAVKTAKRKVTQDVLKHFAKSRVHIGNPKDEEVCQR